MKKRCGVYGEIEMTKQLQLFERMQEAKVLWGPIATTKQD